MKPDNRSEEYSGRSEVFEGDLESALLDYEDTTERTASGKYRCRDCGMLFDTLEELDLHNRTIHGRSEVVSLAGMPM